MKTLLKKLKELNIITAKNKCNTNAKRILKNHLLIKQKIWDATSFISENNTIGERIYCIINNINIQPVCVVCNNPVSFQTNTKEYSKHCSRACSGKDIEVNQKNKTTKKNRYGDENYNNIEKQKQTSLDKHGVIGYNNRKKSKQTCLQRYGVTNIFKSSKFQENLKKQTQIKYGVNYNIQRDDVKQKIKETNLNNRGVDNPFKDSIVQKRIKKDRLEKTNRKYCNQQHITIDSLNKLIDKEWLIEQHHDKQKPLIEIAKALNVSDVTIGNYMLKHNITVNRISGFSYAAINWLEYIMETEDIYIQHALNNSEYHIPNTRYHVDGYCKETNTVYEFLGDIWHGNIDIINENEYCNHFKPETTAKELYQETMNRLQEIQHLGYNIIYIWENDINIT